MNARDTQTRREVVVEASDALADIGDGATIAIGGLLTNGRPMALVRELVRRRLRDLTIVAPVAALDVDLLIAAGCVRKVMSSYVGAEGIAGVAPLYRAGVERGEVEPWDADEAHFAIGLRAAGQGLPFGPWRGGVGTDLPRINPDLVEFLDPIKGEPLIAVPAIRADVALIHATAADSHGNVQFRGPTHLDPLLASAADRVVVQIEQLVTNDEIRREPMETYFWGESQVVVARGGTHPYAATNLDADVAHLESFAAVCRTAVRGDVRQLEAYLGRHCAAKMTHEDYRIVIGSQRYEELAR